MQEAQDAQVAKQAATQQKRLPPGKSGFQLPAGRVKGTQNKLTRTLKEAVEIAARDCHPHGLAGWLIERAQGGIQDRQIFAGLVGKVIPIQVNQSVEGGIIISLNWLAGRQIGTIQAQSEVIEAQPVVSIEHSEPSHWTTNAKAPEPVERKEPSGAPGEENS